MSRRDRSGVSRSAERGQSETVGVVLLLGMTILGTTLVVALGGAALDSAKLDVRQGATRHAMTQFDSEAAIAALGESDVREFTLGDSGDGHYTVEEGAGWVNITHVNHSGSGDVETLVNATLGAVVYEDPETTIAYQGGGVWEGSAGNATMISPPEFHFRAATLTFPIIQVTGNDSASGRVAGRIVIQEDAVRVYPDLSSTYSPGGDVYANPITDGNVTITIHSRYYAAWAQYFRTRTAGAVTEFPGNDTVEVVLVSQGTFGDFEMPAEGNGMEIKNLQGGHPITDFNVTLFSDDEDNADFSNLKWSFYAEKGSQEFEIHLRDNSGGTCGGDVRASVYYTENNGADYQAWTNGSAFQYECENESKGEDFNDDGDSEDKRLVVNFTSQTPMTYDEIKGGDAVIMHFSVSGSDDFVNPTNFSEHDGSVSWEWKEFTEGDRTSIDNVTNHYLEQMGPNLDLSVDDKGGGAGTVNEDASYGHFESEGGKGQFLTYLHVTRNEILVEFE